MSDSGQGSDDTDRQPMQVGTRAKVRVSIVMDYYVDIEMPPNGDPGEQADFELFVRGDWDDYVEKEVLNTEIIEEEPVYEDEYDNEEGWPCHV